MSGEVKGQRSLHMAKCLKELNAMIDTNSGNPNPKLLIKSGDKLYQEAEKELVNKDEEKAYVFFMRFLELYKTIKKSPEYSKDKLYFDKMIGTQKIQTALTKCEQLSVSLDKRYRIMVEANKIDAQLKEDEMKDATENENNRINKSATKKGKISATSSSVVPGTNGVAKPPTASQINNEEMEMTEEERAKASSIHVNALKNLLEQKSTRFLMIDCRFYNDFINSHFLHPNCISIPSELLRPGMSASKVSEALKKSYPQSYIEWSKRAEFDRIILYDWTSSYENMHDQLKILYIAMTKWDPDTPYKSTPVVLQGGIKHTYYSYPVLINKPLTGDPELKKRGDLTNGSGFTDLKSISYPTWDDEKYLNNKSTAPAPSNTIKIINDLSKMDLNPSGSVNNNIPPVTFDRSNKPSRVSSGNITNGPSNNHISIDQTKPMTNGMVNGISPTPKVLNHDPIEDKKSALKLAYDDAIRSNQGVVSLEKEVKDLQVKNLQSQNDALIEALRQKEKDLEELEKQMVNKDENLKILQTELSNAIDQGARESKSTLPPVRVKVDTSLQEKLQEKERLDNYVKQLREERKKREELEKRSLDLKLPNISSPSNLVKPRTSVSTNSTTLPAIHSYGTEIGKGVPNSDPIPIKQPQKPSNSATGLLRPMSQDASPITFQKLKEEPSESPRSGLLKRSHSHPNIAQSLTEEDTSSSSGSVPNQTPNFNRNLKPPVNNRTYVPETFTPTRTREFHPINSTEKHTRSGLKNLGNTCYMNSVMQCLYHLPGLLEFFTRGDHSMVLLKTKDRVRTKGDITSEFGAAISEMNKGHRSLELRCLKNVVGKHNPVFSGTDQQDSHEFLTFILDWLHEELNTRKKIPLNEQKNDGLSDDEAASRAWEDYISSNCSRIIDLFCGQQKSCVKCQMCGKESVTFETFFNLSVPIPATTRRVDVQQCIDLYTSEEEVQDWNCVHCKKKGKARKKIDLWKLPPNLIIHLQRFFYEGWWKKRFTEVDFPIDNLDLTHKVKGKARQLGERSPRYSYELKGVSNHYGTMEAGHYTAYCRKGQHWAKFDDVDVSPMSGRDVVTSTAYILFYSNNSP